MDASTIKSPIIVPMSHAIFFPSFVFLITFRAFAAMIKRIEVPTKAELIAELNGTPVPSTNSNGITTINKAMISKPILRYSLLIWTHPLNSK